MNLHADVPIVGLEQNLGGRGLGAMTSYPRMSPDCDRTALHMCIIEGIKSVRCGSCRVYIVHRAFAVHQLRHGSDGEPLTRPNAPVSMSRMRFDVTHATVATDWGSGHAKVSRISLGLATPIEHEHVRSAAKRACRSARTYSLGSQWVSHVFGRKRLVPRILLSKVSSRNVRSGSTS